jgi:porin
LTLRNEHGDGIGDIRLGGYYDTSNVLGYTSRERDELSPSDPSDSAALAILPAEYVRGRSGAYVQLDHLIAGSSLPHRFGTAIFLAAEYSDPNTALLSSYVDAGIVRHGTFHDRPNDTLSVGFAVANYNPRLQNLQLALQAAGYTVPYNGSEKAFGLNYGWQASNWLVVRPGLQYVLNPNGELTNLPAAMIVPKSALVFGLGTYISF